MDRPKWNLLIMPIKNVFLDRDGVINEVVMRDGQVSSPRVPEEFSIRQEFKDFHKQLSGQSLNFFVVSNQPDVSRNLLDPIDLDVMTALLKQFKFRDIAYCIHDDSHNCQCRKPKPGMINSVLDKFKLAREESLIIGDSKKDIQAGQAASITTIYLKRSYNSTPECSPNYIVSTLAEAVGIIVGELGIVRA